MPWETGKTGVVVEPLSSGIVVSSAGGVVVDVSLVLVSGSITTAGSSIAAVSAGSFKSRVLSPVLALVNEGYPASKKP